MARSKLVALARTLTLAASVGAPCIAQAADLLPPPPPPPMAPPVEVGGGWYLRGDVGVGASNFDSVELRPSNIIPTGYVQDGYAMADQAFAGGGVGYQFNNFFRADVTGEYRGGGHLSFSDKYPGVYNAGTEYETPGHGINLYGGKLSTIVVMANGAFDLGNWYGVTPYVTGGVGSAFHQISGFTDIGAGTATGGFGTAKTKYSSSFAWAVGAGFSFDVTQQFKVDVGYRFINLGSAKSAPVYCNDGGCQTPASYRFKDITSHDVKIGLRYMLGGGYASSLPALAPDYQPAPGPLVRKY